MICPSDLPSGKVLRELSIVEMLMTKWHVYARGTSQIVMLMAIQGDLDLLRLQRVYETICLNEPALSAIVIQQADKWLLFRPDQPAKPLFVYGSFPKLSSGIEKFDRLLEAEVDNTLDIGHHLIRLTVLGEGKHYLLMLTLAHSIADAYIGKRLLSQLLCETNVQIKSIVEIPEENEIQAEESVDDVPSPPEYDVQQLAKRIHTQLNDAVKALPPASDTLETGLHSFVISSMVLKQLTYLAKQHQLSVNALVTSLISQVMMDLLGLAVFKAVTALSYRNLFGAEITDVGCLIASSSALLAGDDVFENAHKISQEILLSKQNFPQPRAINEKLQHLGEVMITSRDQVIDYCSEVIFTNNGSIDKVRLPANLKLKAFRTVAAMPAGHVLTTFHIYFLYGQLFISTSYSKAIISPEMMNKLVENIRFRMFTFAFNEN